MQSFFHWQQTLKNNPAIRFIKERNMDVFSYFLYKHFRDTNNLELPEEFLVNALTDFLQDNPIQNDTAENEYIKDYKAKAKEYIKRWSNNEHLYLYPRQDGNTGEYFYQPSSYLMRVFQWIESLEQKEFVGTESRLEDIFEKLAMIIQNAKPKTDKEYIAELEEKRAALAREIKEVRAKTRKFQAYDTYKIQEDYDILMNNIKGLTSDFKEVEENFKTIGVQLIKQQTEEDKAKGEMLQFVLDAKDQLEISNQGKSFYAFYDLLSNTAQVQKFENEVELLFATLTEKSIPYDKKPLKHFIRSLNKEASQVLNYNKQLATKIRKMVEDGSLRDRKIILQLINSLKNTMLNDATIEVSSNFEKEFWTINAPETQPKDLPLRHELQLVPPQKPQPIAVKIIETQEPLNLEDYFKNIGIDLQVLKRNIDDLLQKEKTININDIHAEFPLRGMSESLAYIYLATQKSKKNDFEGRIADENRLQLCYNTEKQLYLSIPQIFFTRN
jgi:hypothetical protein